MMEIENIDTSAYSSYWFAPTVEPLSIKRLTPNGLTDVDGYGLFLCSGGTVIAFSEQQDGNGYTDYIAIGENFSQRLQLTLFEDSLDLFDEKQLYQTSAYIFNDSIVVNSENIDNTIFDFEQRCDSYKYGPRTFYDAAERVSGSLVRFRFVVSVSGAGHIIRVDLSGLSNEQSQSEIVKTSAQSFPMLLKQILEWREYSRPPHSSQEPAALRSNDFIDGLGIDDDTLGELMGAIPDMRIRKLMKGEDIYSFMPDCGIFPESLKNYLKTVFRYSTLSSLKKNNPFAGSIPESVLINEKAQIENSVLSFCMSAGIDVDEISARELYYLLLDKTYVSSSEEFTSIQRFASYA